MNLGAMEIGLIIFAVLLLFGYKRLPDASRSLGRSLRIFKGEMKGLKADDLPTNSAGTSRNGEVLVSSPPVGSAEAEARTLEARAAELRAYPNHARPDGRN
jgi:sec-independent protein translocase protein TatA